MTTSFLQPLALHTTSTATALAARSVGLLFSFLLFAAGWTFVADQQAHLWARLPASTMDRFVADQVAAPLPRLLGAAELQAACARPLSWKAQWRRAWLRADLADCFAAPDGLTTGAAAEHAVQHYEALLAQQAAAADAWLTEFDAQVSTHRMRLQADLVSLQAQPAGSMARWLQAATNVLPASPSTVRENLDAGTALERAARTLREQTQASRARVAALAQSAQIPGERARQLALMTTGLQLVTDYGVAPPAAHLTTARNTLADALEWQRRARGYQERGFTLADLQALPSIVLASSVLLLLVVAVTTRGSALAVGLWAMATLLLGMSALMLTDVALTGDPSLRYLAVRQFQSFGVGDWWVPLTLAMPVPGLPDAIGTAGNVVVTLWWPLVLTAVGLLALRAVRQGAGWALAPVRAWVRWGGDVRWGALQSALLLGAGTLMVLFLGMPAAISELLILLGCVGVASYLARQAPHANVGAGLQPYNLILVASALALAVGGSVARGDLGHALVALLLAACFAWLFGWAWLRVAVLLAAVAAITALAVCLVAGNLVGPLAGLADWLPPHAQDRILAMFDPYQAASSDLARVRWLMQSADLDGWGLGYAPWQGLAAARVQDGLPLQGPSDYVLALTTTLWGQAGGLALMGVVLTVFSLAAVLGLRTALRSGMPSAVRWLPAVGGFGCVVMAAKVVLSVGGVTGVLPLTGLPVGLLGYGPVTHLAALLYLALALGTLHVRPVQAQRGVNVQARPVPTGAVRRRGLGLALASMAGLCSLLVLGYQHMRADPGAAGQRHVAHARLELAQALAVSMVPKAPDTVAVAAPVLPCDELGNAVAAWNLRLSALQRPVRVATGDSHSPALVTSALQLDAARLSAAQPMADHAACRSLARTLGQMLDTDLPRLVGRQTATHAASTPSDAVRLSVFDKPRAMGARQVDYATANAWWGRPGCLLPAEGLPDNCAQQSPGDAKGWTAETLGTEVVTDIWLQRHLAPQLYVAQRTPSGAATLNNHAVAVGPALGLTLVPALQQAAQRTADCATGRLHGADCEAVLPKDPTWRQRHYGTADALRSGAMGIVLAEVDSGRVVAMAGAVSDCTLDHLGQPAQADAQGQMPALRDGKRCAQLPDQRSAWLAQQAPALWMVPPGSALKPFSLLAGMDAGVMGAGGDDYWKGILAESHERLPIQRTALAAGQRYLDVLSGVGFAADKPVADMDLLWGGMTTPEGKHLFRAKWAAEAYGGTQTLRATSMSLAQAEQIRREKLAGVNVDKRYGEAVTTEFVAARKLADASVGGGDIRINALGLVDAWRALDLRARGHTSVTALHLLEQPKTAIPAKSLAWASPQAAARVLGMTTGVTASAWKGTAQGSCRVVFGACAPQGLAGLSGKTGSSDFLTEEDGPNVKPGIQLPAKLFGGVFAAPDGKRYAVAVMALRVREGSKRTLELTSSAPAEAALTMIRSMGVR